MTRKKPKSSRKIKINKKRISFSKLTREEAQSIIDVSKGMTKAKWERLWDIAHRKR